MNIKKQTNQGLHHKGFFSPSRNSQPGPELWFTLQSEEVMFLLVFGRGTFFYKACIAESNVTKQ